MDILPIAPDQKSIFNSVVSHPLQSYQWGQFREKTGLNVIRRGIFDKNKLLYAFQMTIHPIPHTPFTIGYLPKSDLPNKLLLTELKKIGLQHRCIFIQLEPNVVRSINGNQQSYPHIQLPDLIQAAHPLFTKYTFILDLTRSEDALLEKMHQKARYNIRVAQKHNVLVREDNSDNAFDAYLRLTGETTKRQRFYAHTPTYHRLQWQTFTHIPSKNDMTSHLFTASYDGKILTTLLFFVFRDTLYYPYGASSNEHRNVMHSNLAMWEGIRFGKKLGLKKFDMWGAMGPNPDPKDPWFGFHNFKEKFGPDHVEFIGSFDLVINPLLYQAYKAADKLRWLLLRLNR